VVLVAADLMEHDAVWGVLDASQTANHLMFGNHQISLNQKSHFYS